MDILSNWYQQLESYLPMLALGVAVFIVAFLLSAPLSRWLSAPLQRLTNSQLIKLVIRRTLRALVILVGLYVFLRLAGLTEFAVAVISGTGLIGLILGFAFKDIAENFIASILLSIQRPFKIGDVIEAEGHLGVIKQVTSRATTLVDFDGNHIQIPNATIYKNIIKNYTANPNMRGHFSIGIGYENNIRDAQQRALACMSDNTAVLSDPEPMVLIDNLGSSTINMTCYFWINSHTFSVIKVASALMHTVVKNYMQAGISMPDDARERIFPEGLRMVTGDASADESHTLAPANNQRIADDDAPDGPLDTETDEIRQQAANARDPEQGENIL